MILHGHQYGYHINSAKTHPITKERHHAAASSAFSGIEVKITSDGKSNLGAALGTLVARWRGAVAPFFYH